RKGADLMGIGHPLVDAILDYFSSAAWRGDVTTLACQEETQSFARFVVEAFTDDGQWRTRYESVVVSDDGSWRSCGPRADLDGLNTSPAPIFADRADAADFKSRVQAAMSDAEARSRAEHQHLVSVRTRLVGLARSASSSELAGG